MLEAVAAALQGYPSEVGLAGMTTHSSKPQKEVPAPGASSSLASSWAEVWGLWEPWEPRCLASGNHDVNSVGPEMTQVPLIHLLRYER